MGTGGRLRVAHLALEWPQRGKPVGGVGRYVHRLVAALRSDLDQVVITGADPEPMDGVVLSPLPAVAGRAGRYYASPLLAAARLRRLNVAVVHAHGDDWALPAAAPVLRTFYGSSLNEARTSPTLLRTSNHLLLAGLEWVSARRATMTVAIAEESRKRFSTDAVVPPLILREAALQTKSPDPTVAFVGEHQSRKRGWLAVQVVEELKADLDGLQLIVVGPESDRLKYPGWVHFRSGLSDAQVGEVLSSAWVLLAPSSYEGFGIVLVEAMLAGAAVVATPNDGSSEILSGGRYGALAEDEELVGSLRRLLCCADLRDRLTTAAQWRAQELLDRADPRRYLEWYRQLALRDR